MRYLKIFTRLSTGGVRDVLPKRKRPRVIPSTNNMIANIPAPDNLDKLLCNLAFFFRIPLKGRWRRLRARQKTPASHWRANTYSAFSFDK